MTIASNLLFIALLALIGYCRYHLVQYRRLLYGVLSATQLDLIKQQLVGVDASKKLETVKTELNLLFFWIPYVSIAAASIIVMWGAVYVGAFSPLYAAIVSVVVGALITKCIHTDRSPQWLLQWYYDIITAANTKHMTTLINEMDQIVRYLTPYANGEIDVDTLTESERIEIALATKKLLELQLSIDTLEQAQQALDSNIKSTQTHTKE